MACRSGEVTDCDPEPPVHRHLTVLPSARILIHGEITGMSDALAAIAAQTYGKILIGITGFGLMCYAVHMGLMGWIRQFNVG